MSKPDRTCTRCGKKHLDRFTWLELDTVTGIYHEPGTINAARSQGLFPFGQACAKRQLEQRQAPTVASAQREWMD